MIFLQILIELKPLPDCMEKFLKSWTTSSTKNGPSY